MGTGQIDLIDPGLAVDTHAHAHAPFGHGEQRLGRPRQCAAGKCYAEGAGQVVGTHGEVKDRVHVVAALSGIGQCAEYGQISGDTTPLGRAFGRPAADIVGHGQAAGRDALGLQALGGNTEIQHVAGIVAERHDHARIRSRGLGHGVDLLGRGRGKDIAHGRPVGQALAHQPGKGRVMARAAADDDRDFARRGHGGPYHAAGYALDQVGIGGHKAINGFIDEIGRLVEEITHDVSAKKSRQIIMTCRQP